MFSITKLRSCSESRKRSVWVLTCAVLVCVTLGRSFAADFAILKPADFSHYIDKFNSMDGETITNAITNADSADWLQKEIPFFDCPDRGIEEIYYFRWWSFRKHIAKTPAGFVITEFLTPVHHAGIYNTVSCAAGFHLAEGRWLHDQKYLNDYTRFWLSGENGKSPKKAHNFSSWLAAAAYDRYLVNHDRKFVVSLLGKFVADYRLWEQEHQLTNGLFWQYDVRDGMEESISGSRTAENLRPTINSYMFANARAIAEIATLAGKQQTAKMFAAKAAELRKLTQATLWNPDASFFEVRAANGDFSDVREELGFIPWMFELPEPNRGYETAWLPLTDPRGFRAPAGITTAERRNPQFRSHGVDTCEWDGAVWPFATSQTLYALANVLRDYPQKIVTPQDYFDAFQTYARSQRAEGKPYIGEYLDEVTGDWINGKGDRSRYYNHSTFADLVITGIVGLRPRADDVIEVNPLLPAETWNWFCLDGVKYHGHMITVVWDKDGTHYGRGSGLRVLADGKQIGRNDTLAPLKCRLP